MPIPPLSILELLTRQAAQFFIIKFQQVAHFEVHQEGYTDTDPSISALRIHMFRFDVLSRIQQSCIYDWLKILQDLKT